MNPPKPSDNPRPAKRARTASPRDACAELISPTPVAEMSEDAFVKEIFGKRLPRADVVKTYYKRQSNERKHDITTSSFIASMTNTSTGEECVYLFVRAAVRFDIPIKRAEKAMQICALCGETIQTEKATTAWNIATSYILIQSTHTACFNKRRPRGHLIIRN